MANPRETTFFGFPAQYNSLRSRKQELQLAPLPKGAPKEASFREIGMPASLGIPMLAFKIDGVCPRESRKGTIRALQKLGGAFAACFG